MQIPDLDCLELWCRAIAAAECSLAGVALPAIRFRRRAANRRVRWLPDKRGRYRSRTTGERYRKTFQRLPGKPPLATGRTNEVAGIRVMVGTDFDDARLVFLHELAHWLVGPRHAHDVAFWQRAWDLYEKYGIDDTYAVEREGSYRKGALLEYRRRRIGQ